MKSKSARQTVCNEPGKTAKQAFCGGKLKCITTIEPEITNPLAKDLDIFRCQDCGTLYSEKSPYVRASR